MRTTAVRTRVRVRIRSCISISSSIYQYGVSCFYVITTRTLYGENRPQTTQQRNILDRRSERRDNNNEQEHKKRTATYFDEDKEVKRETGFRLKKKRGNHNTDKTTI